MAAKVQSLSRKLLAAAAIFVSMAVAPAVAQEDIDRVVISGGVDVVGLNAIDENVILPDRGLMSHISDSLIRWKAPGVLQPWLATSYELIDPNTWELKLRQGVTFHNGEPFNAAVVKFTFEQILSEANGASTRRNYTMVTEVEIVDDYTVRLHTNAPSPLVPNLLTSLNMMPPQYIKEVGVDGYRSHPIGTGAYRFVRHIRDTELVLESTGNYWAGPQRIKTIVYRPIKDDAARVAALVTGEIDMAVRLPPELVPMVEGARGMQVKPVKSARSFILLFSSQKPEYPTNNVKVREAINYAIDRESLNANILTGLGAPVSWYNPYALGYDTSIEPIKYDPERAKKLLAEAGYPNGFTIAMDSPTAQYVKDVEMAQAIVGQLAQVGITVQLQAMEYGNFQRRVFAKEASPITLIGWGDSRMDPHSHNALVLDSGGSWNQLGDPELDARIKAIATEMDPAKREALIKEEQVYLRQLWPAAYLLQLADIYGVSEKLSWWSPRADEKLVLYQDNIK